VSAADLLSQLRELGVRLKVQGGELKVSAPKGVLTADLREQLKAAKADLTELLLLADTAAHPKKTAIPHADRTQTLPLSFAQQRMWFLEEFEGGSSVYNIPWAMRLRGELNVSALQQAADALVARHESLRTVFLKTAAQPEQKVLDHLPLIIEQTQLHGAAEAALREQLEVWSRESFDLTTGPLLRVRLIEVGQQDHVLMMVMHHIISDAWSLDVLQTELFSAYFAACEGQPIAFDPLPLQFADYAAWQRSELQSEELDRQLSYWQEKLRGAPPLLELPTDRARPAEQSFNGARVRRLLPLALRDDLQTLAKANNGTLFMILLAAFNVLLARYSGQDDIVVGTPIAGRQRTDLEGLIGLFLNTLVFRTDLSAAPTFTELLAQVQSTALDAYAHQDVPFDKIVDAVQPSRDMSYSPVFQVQFMLQNAPASGEPVAGLAIENVEFEYGTSKFDLTLATGETPDGLMAEVEYCTDLFDSQTIERMLEHFQTLLEGIVADPAAAVTRLPLISTADHELLQEWNATDVVYPGDETLPSLLTKQADATPAALALVFEDESLTYAELNGRANQLAHWLQAQGVGKDVMVGVFMERSTEMVVALLAIVKAGGAYVPLDPDYPEQRLEHMLEDADMPLVLTQSHLQAQLPAHNAQVLAVDTAAELSDHATENPSVLPASSDVAYVIFTSGSTGRPKGVMNEHRGIVNRLLWMQSEYQLDDSDRVLQKTPFSFDVSVWEFFWPLMTGATLVVARPGGHKDSTYLTEIIREQGVTTMHFVPSMLQVFLQDPDVGQCESLRRVICSGEALSHDLQTRFYGSFANTGLHNLYGPTEAAIDVTYWACQRDSDELSVPIGRPVANTQVHVVEPSGSIAPVGVAGELWIGGEQVARGYVNRPELTAERFIADPFGNKEGARIYRTGDLVRWRNDGVVEFLGRIDQQVKLRGFRIELGEIEASLDAQLSVEQSLVLLREDVPGDKRLVAYVTGTDGVSPDVPVLRDALKAQLPEYMVPAAFVPLQNFPLLPNGKVNRRALPEPEGRRDVASEYMPPATATEKILAQIWSDLLRVDRVGVNDNFFELGGDSILSIQIITRAGQEGLHLVPKQVFQYQTIAELATAVGEARTIDAEQGEVCGTASLTPVQRWFFAGSPIEQQHFNQSISLRLNARMDAHVIDDALQALRVHHDAFRLRFRQQPDSIWQEFAAADRADILMQLDLRDVAEDARQGALLESVNALQAGFSLDSGCLIAALLVEYGDDVSQELIITVHHLAMDGLSWRILLEDLETVTAQLQQSAQVKLPAKTSSFKAWSDRLTDYATSAELALEADWWAEHKLIAPATPLDTQDGANTVQSARTHTVTLTAEQTSQLLQNVPKAYRTQINDVLLTALARAWHSWCGQAQLLVDLEGHGREAKFDDIDISRTIGWFTTIYPVSVSGRLSEDPGDTLKRTKEALRAVPDKGFGYGVLRYLSPATDLAAIAEADIVFNYLGQFDQTFAAATQFELSETPRGYEQGPNRERSHLLDINSSVYGGQLQISITYSQNRHFEATIAELADCYVTELNALIEHCRSGEHLGYTPSDFPLADLEQEAIDRLTHAIDVEDIYPATAMQHGMLFHSIFSREAIDYLSQVYVSQVLWELEGEIDAAAFEQAWRKVVERHEVLRTGFQQSGLDQPLAIVHRSVDLQLNVEDWADQDFDTQIERLKVFLDDDRNRGFDLHAAPLMRIHLLRFGEQNYRFIWSHHHVIMDGWSIPIILGELFGAYEALTANKLPAFGPARPYRNYIDWLAQQDRDAAAAYWQDALGDMEAPTPLPGARRVYRGVHGETSYDKHYIAMSEEDTAAIRQLAKDLRLTPNTLAQGVWALLLSRYTGESDVTFGATTSGRPADLKHVEDMVGLFLNTLPIRVHIKPQESLRSWLAELQEQQLAARQHEYASLVDVQGWSAVPRGTSLFHTLLIYENYPDVSSLWTDKNAIKVKDMQALGWTSFPLTANVAISRQLVLRLSYDQDYYDAAAASELADQFESMLQSLLQNPDVPVSELLRAPAAEPSRQLMEAQTEHRDAFVPIADAGHNLATAFEAQVARTPDAPAVVAADASWTYAELNAQANGIARVLLDAGLRPGERAGMLLGQNATMLAGLFGALKAGLVYVPLDPNTPAARLEKIREDAGLRVLVCDPAYRFNAEELARGAADLPIVEARQTPVDGNPALDVSPDDLSYILFTSGSTGVPKGVTQTHRNVLHHVRVYANALYINASDRLNLFAPYGFDAAVMDIYGALLTGACLYPIDIKAAESAREVLDAVARDGITIFHSTPTVYRFLLEQHSHQSLEAVRLVVLGGEETRVADFELFCEKFPAYAVFVNGLGPTESTLALQYFANHETRMAAGVVPVGAAVEGTELLLLDEQGEPAGLQGEICIRGEHITPGYWQADELNASAFVEPAEGGPRIYRTGDLGRYLPDGNLVFLGRRDAQVKVRGNRIEPGEIEAVINGCDGIDQCAVVLREDKPGDPGLAAYFVAEAAADVALADVRRHVQERLPGYMVPAAFVELDAIPLTPNGKLDRNALPAPVWESDTEYVAPRNDNERRVAEVWADVLGVEQVGVNDDFFALGGHSLIATQLMSRIRDEIGYELPLRALFETSTVAGLCELLERTSGAGATTSIRPRDPNAIVPLSYPQQRLYFLEQLEPGTSVYNLSWSTRLKGRLNADALQAAVNDLVARHESLRTHFADTDTGPVQVIAARLELPLERHDLGGRDEAALKQHLESVVRQPFDLNTGPLLRVQLIATGDDEHVLLVMIHHIISDAWSSKVLMQDLIDSYAARSSGAEAELSPLAVQYPDYSVWQRDWLAGEELDRQVGFWRDRLAGAPTVLEMPTDRPRPPVQTYNGAHAWWRLSAETSAALRRLASEQGCTLFMVLVSAYALLLGRYSRQDDLLIGTPIAGRQHTELEKLIGFFVNTLVLRADFSGQPTFREYLQRIKRESLDAFAHQDLPFEKLVEELQPERDTSRSPLFQAAFILQNTPNEAASTFADLSAENVFVEHSNTKFDLTLGVWEDDEGIGGSLEYNTDLFDAATIESLLEHLTKLLEGAIANPDAQVGALPLLNDTERQRLLVDWNATEFDYPRDGTMHGLFEQQAALQPDAIALYTRAAELTYRELNRRANKLAGELAALGVGPETLVGVCCQRDAEIIVGLLAILKAGGAYVPIDPNYPAERVAFMLEDSQAPVLLSQTQVLEQLPQHEAQVICLDSFDWHTDDAHDANPASGVTAANLGYTIYTSGSTGLPKGVEIEHRNAVALIEWAGSVFAREEFAGVLASTSVCFDLSVYEIFVTLGQGGRIVLVSNALELPDLPAEANVTLINTVPSAIAELVRMQGLPASVKTVNLAGEPLQTWLVNEIYATGTVQDVNDLYGPSEDTTYSTWTRREADAPPTVGKPIANTQVYLLDEYGEPVPAGVIGEMYLGGSGVTRGYRNRPELTTEKFLANPFSSEPDARMYRTGDQARYRRDGNIEFLGRIDQQVKLRGFRIELGEVETRLREEATVNDAVVIIREDTPGDQRMVAYVTAAPRMDIVDDELRASLQVNLPGFMIPSTFVVLDAIPLTPNGKVDRKALPAPEWSGAEEYTAPRNVLEEQLCALWTAVLGIDQAGIHDDFFALGGHSLLAMQLASRIRDSLDVDMELATLFSYPTVAGLAEQLAGAQPLTDEVPLQRCDREVPLAMSFAQQRLWFLDVMEPGGSVYNVPWAARLQGHLNRAALQAAVSALVERHESLRTTFADGDDGPVQIIHAAMPVEIEYESVADTESSARIQALNARPFDLSSGPLIRVSILEEAEDCHVLLICMHHIICDAWSQGVVYRDLAALYEAKLANAAATLPAFAFEYADYAVWQRDWLSGAELERQFGYWRAQLTDAPPLLDMPLDKPRPPVETHHGAAEGLLLDGELAAELHALAKQSGTTVFVVLMAAMNVLLHRYSGDDDIVVGTPISGRKRSELEDLVGFFLNTLAIRTELGGDLTFRDLLAGVKRTVLEAFAHQDLPFEKLVEELQPTRNLSHAPIFQTLFVFNPLAAADTSFGGLELSNLEYEITTAKFDLQLSVTELADGLSANIQYNTDLFERATIQRMLGHFARLLRGIVHNPVEQVRSIPMLAEGERDRLVHDFNATATGFPTNSLVGLVQAQMAKNPAAIALEAGAAVLTYAELDQRTNRLAHQLVDKGVTPGSLVGVCVERCLEAPLAILAVLKAGAAYVPIDPTYPADRVEYMLADSAARVLLTQSALVESLAPGEAEVICIDEFDWESGNASAPSVDIAVDDPAYAIYTSGSTGLPKGVLLPQGGLANLLQWQDSATSLNAPARTLQFASFSFDVSFQELFSTWQQGGTLVMIDEQLRRDLPALASFVAARNIERLYLPYAALQPLVESILLAEIEDTLAIRDIIVAGEQLQITPPLRKFFAASGARLHNQYGPSETHVVTAYTLQGEPDSWPALPSIGAPVANTQVYVLDENFEPLPVGVPGELYIGGVQVALGYLNRDELTAEKFVDNPFIKGSRLYRTGDRVRFLPDGNIEYTGRTDDQVKWRGFRIEPGEIEALLASHAQVRLAAVMLREDDPGDKRLIAYVVAEQGQDIEVSDMRSLCKEHLPDYMVPSGFMVLDEMPLTPSGKVARRQLPPLASEREGSEGERATTTVQKNLAAIWAHLLKLDTVMLDDNFFDLGGHSLLTIQLAQKVQAATGRQLSIADVFENPTVRELSPLLEDASWDMEKIDLAQPGFFGRLLRAFVRIFKRDQR